MSDPQIAIFMLGLFIFMVLLGFPIAFTLLAMGLGFGYYAYYDELRMDSIFDNRIFDLTVQNTFSVMSNDVLVAIPLFLFMGYVVERANIVNRLFFSLQLAARHLPGSMAVAALMTCAIFATATGIIGAVVTLMGMLAFPAMLKAGYNHSFASGVICAGGCLGILIPPSIMLIVYAAIAELSPLRLYAAAMFPGLILAGFYMIYVVIRAMINPSLAPKPKEEDVPPAGQIMFQVVTSVVPLAVLILSVLGCILFGLATPAEAAGVGALGGLVLAILYRSLTWERFKESVYLTAKTSAMVCWLFVGSWTFASVFFVSRWTCTYRRMDSCAKSWNGGLSYPCSINYFSFGMAIGMDRNSHYFRANLSTDVRYLWRQSLYVCHAYCAEFADVLSHATYGYVCILFKRCRPAIYSTGRYF